jgi:transcriptional regulator with XRE-family HTH domain
MNQYDISFVGPRAKQIRLAKEIKLIDVAANAGISKGLLSRIENGRVSPSLPVLFALIGALGETPASFFEDMKPTTDKPFYILKHEQDYLPVTKEDSIGFHYFSIMSHTFSDITFNATLLKLDPQAQREPATTEGMEFIYLIRGEINYNIGREAFAMNEGDSLFFDGRVPHLKINNSGETAKILVIYFLFNK